MAKVIDVANEEITPDDGVDVRNTRMLSGLGDLPAGYNDVNVVKPVEGKPQPKAGKTE